MSRARTWGLRAVLAAALLAFGAWYAANSEWVETEVQRPLGRAAQSNPHYAVEQLLQQLGAKPQRVVGLERLPPRRGTLWLASPYWEVTASEDQRLRQWVEAGGHLVLYATVPDEDEFAWVPVRPGQHPDDKKAGDADTDEERGADGETPPAPEVVCSEDDDVPCPEEPDDPEDADEPEPADLEPDEATGPLTQAAPSPATLAASRRRLRAVDPARDACLDLVEPPGVPPAYGAPRRYRFCGPAYGTEALHLRDKNAPVRWSVARAGTDAASVLRVAVGRGSVTVMGDDFASLFSNTALTAGDHGLLLVAALQARPGTPVWIVEAGRRASLPVWLWQHASTVLLLGALALALGLWRGAVRFGPPIAPLPPGRRSMAEQVRGTAAFLQRSGPQALLTAQIRALDECAGQHLPHYAQLARGARAELLARATGLDVQALANALDRSRPRSSQALAHTLELLETARRRLLDAVATRTLTRRLGTPTAGASTSSPDPNMRAP